MSHIEQGSNTPIKVMLKKDVIFDNVLASFTNNEKVIYEWSEDKIRFDGNEITLLLNQEDTLNLPKGRIGLELKLLFENQVIMVRKLYLTVIERLDNRIFTTATENLQESETIEADVVTNVVVVEIGTAAVKTVNSNKPDVNGNVNLTAKDIPFIDGETFQQKYDNGELKGSQGEKGEPGLNGEPGKSLNFNDLTDEQKEELTGPQGKQGSQGNPGENGKDGLTTKINLNNTEYIQENGVISLPDLQSKEIERTITGPIISIDCNDNEIITIDGLLNDLTITEVNGIGLIRFVSGDTVIINLPDGTDWNENTEPTIKPNMYYNLTYVYGTFYLDGGR